MILAAFAPLDQPDSVRGLLVVLVAVSIVLLFLGSLSPWLVRRKALALGEQVPENFSRFSRRCLWAGLAGFASAVIIGVIHAIT